MKNRSVRRQFKAPENWSNDVNELERKKFYLLSRLGPLLFVLKSGSSGNSSDGVFKVWIGSPNHRCSCGGGTEKNCIHINFVLLKILRLDPSNPLAWKTQLSEEDINLILNSGSSGRMDAIVKHEFLKRGAAVANTSLNHTEDEVPLQLATRKTLDENEVCVICQEEISEIELLDNLLCYCNLGCGSNFHLSCVKILTAHSRSERKDARCPLCRAQIKAVSHEIAEGNKKEPISRVMPALRCNHCRVKIHNQFARCIVCAGLNTCLRCFNSGSLNNSHDPSHPWLSAKVTQYPAEWSVIVPPASNANRTMSDELISLQHRDLQPSDYGILLSLNSTQQTVPLYEHLTNALPDVPSCLKQCAYCTVALSIDRSAKQFPCGHVVHKSCAVSVILSALSDSGSEGIAASKITCPFCPRGEDNFSSDQPSLLFPALQREPKTKSAATKQECESKPKPSENLKKPSIEEALLINGSNAVATQVRANDMSAKPIVQLTGRHIQHQVRKSRGQVSSIARKPLKPANTAKKTHSNENISLEIGGLCVHNSIVNK